MGFHHIFQLSVSTNLTARYWRLRPMNADRQFDRRQRCVRENSHIEGEGMLCVTLSLKANILRRCQFACDRKQVGQWYDRVFPTKKEESARIDLMLPIDFGWLEPVVKADGCFQTWGSLTGKVEGAETTEAIAHDSHPGPIDARKSVGCKIRTVLMKRCSSG